MPFFPGCLYCVLKGNRVTSVFSLDEFVVKPSDEYFKMPLTISGETIFPVEPNLLESKIQGFLSQLAINTKRMALRRMDYY